MKNLNNTAKIASSLRRLRESHEFEGNMIASILGLKEKEYSKLERGSRELNLYQLCILSEFYKIRKSVVLDYGNPKNKETNEEIRAINEEIAASAKWLNTIMGKISVCEMKLNKKISA
mgnify:CR=1 FL=1